MAAKKKTRAAAPSQSDPRAPLDAAAFLSAAQRVLVVLRDDLLTRADESPGVTDALRAQWTVEKEAKRTGDPWEVWRRRIVVQIAAAWVLSLVFARTLEDRGLLERNRIAGPGAADSQEQFRGIAPYLSDRDYLLTVFQELSNLPAAKELFDPTHNPVWKLGPSIEGARALLDLFRSPDPEAPAFRFGQVNTRFLGDLYQSLDEETQERFALLQTPHFIEAYILDRTLERAITRFGLDDTTLIDPTCGSGHFLLGALERLVDHRCRKEPGLDVREAARKALDAVYGADINPYAVAIARFRLTLAFLATAGYARLTDAPKLPLHLVVADSLLHNPQHAQANLGEVAGQSMEAWGGNEFALENEEAARDVLHRRFAAVVGNPPYISVKDPVLRVRYKLIYSSCFREFTLATPFTERFFLLAKPGGCVGLITENGFMKRERGKKLIESYLPTVNVDGIVNTSEAYIPGHATPTVLLFGTNEPKQGTDVLSVLAKHGEPRTPDDPARGFVWSSITDHGGEVAFENEYISVARVPRTILEKHPWSLGGGGAAELKELLEERAAQTLRDIADMPIGRAARVGMDDVYMLPPHATLRIGGDAWRDLLIGEAVRDWGVAALDKMLFPYDLAKNLTVRNEDDPGLLPALRYLWPFRTALAQRATFQGVMSDAGLKWYEYMQYTASANRTPLSIAFAFVATHNHFVLDRGGKVFKQSAPIIKLKEGATEEDHLALLAYLNSSTACFWMKQVCYDKGSGTGSRQPERAKGRLEFAGTAIAELPIPNLTAARRRRLSSIAKTISSLSGARGGIIAELVNGIRSFADAKRHDATLMRRAIALQEDLDWSIYSAFGLSDVRDAECPPDAEMPLGARAFEVAAARRGNTTGIDGQVLSAAGVTCSDVDIGRDRIAASTSGLLATVEVASYKRRWVSTPKHLAGRVETLEDRLGPALLDAAAALVERTMCDAAPQPTPVSSRLVDRTYSANPMAMRLATLAGDAGLDLWLGAPDLLEANSVPFVAAHRFTESGMEKFGLWQRTWELQRCEDAGNRVEVPVPPKYESGDYCHDRYDELRGKLDVPKERFISYPGCESDEDKDPVYGWAGWNHLQRAIALATLYLMRKQGEAWGKGRLVPMLAGLDELLPWIWQWHPEPTPESGGTKPGQYVADFLSAQCQELGATLDEVRAWRPELKKSGAEAARKTRTPRKSRPSAEEETP